MLYIMTDTGADFSLEKQDELGIYIRPIHIAFDDEEIAQETDEDILAFYKRLEKEKNIPTTSRPSPGELMLDFKTQLEKMGPDDQLLYITLSSGLSGSYEMALHAKEEMKDDRIFVFDSLSATYGQTMQVFRAMEKAKEGFSANEVMEDLKNFRKYIFTELMLDTLSHLKKGGRIPGPLASFGNVLSIKPNVIESSMGYVELLSINRGRKSSLNKQMKIFEKYHWVEKYQPVILYSSDKELATKYQEMVYERLHFKPGFLHLSPVIGAHIGPRSIGLCGVLKKETNDVFYPASKKWRK